MPVKFDQYWSVIPEKHEEYRKFVIKSFIPHLNKLGIHTVAGWSVVVGSYAQIIMEGVSNDLDQIEKALVNPKFRELKGLLHNFIGDYKSKILTSTGRKNGYTTDIEANTIKFSQSWDICINKIKEYERYVSETFYPAMESFGVQIASEWEVLIGDGPGIICEGRTRNIDKLLHSLQSKKFAEVKTGLSRYVCNYSSRFLSFHIQKIKGYKSESYALRP